MAKCDICGGDAIESKYSYKTKYCHKCSTEIKLEARKILKNVWKNAKEIVLKRRYGLPTL
jgi:transcription initiation factor TFIIIB Brf1 subunit/transcription initiation factor TFIIB